MKIRWMPNLLQNTIPFPLWNVSRGIKPLNFSLDLKYLRWNKNFVKRIIPINRTFLVKGRILLIVVILLYSVIKMLVFWGTRLELWHCLFLLFFAGFWNSRQNCGWILQGRLTVNWAFLTESNCLPRYWLDVSEGVRK
jgi:hypothetical protein